jgi:FKBP-type peptidyl-prolyl cis-trans isomerase FkpA
MKYPVLAALAVAVASLHAADEAKSNPAAPAPVTPPPAPKVNPTPLTAEELKKVFFFHGYRIAQSIKSQVGLTEANAASIADGFKAVAKGDKMELKEAELQPLLERFEAERREIAEKEAAVASKAKAEADAKYFAKLDEDKTVKKTASGLRYRITVPGSDEKPVATSLVKCHYEGKLTDGTVFDASKKHGTNPVEFPLNRVIPAWTEGVQLIGKGGKITLFCPSELAYGEQGSPPVIPPNSILEFEVELVEISKAK